MLGLMATIPPLRKDRSDLRIVIGLGIAASIGIAFTAIMGLWNQLASGTVPLPLRVSVAVPTLRGGDGAIIGHGGTLSTAADVSALPGDAVVWLQLGAILPPIATIVAVLLVVGLAAHILRRGLFEPTLVRRVRLTAVLGLLVIVVAHLPTTIGTRIALASLDLDSTHWTAASGPSLTHILVFVAIVTWCEVVVRAGARLARDQDGLI